MDKKRILITSAILVVLAALIYLQFRHWKSFDWATFWSETHQVNPWHIVHAIALIYLGYVLRAIRWRIFLRPVRPRASFLQLIPPTLIGFAGMALLGRPGEFMALPDRTSRESAHYVPNRGVGGGTYFRHRSVCCLDGIRDLPADSQTRLPSPRVLQPLS